MGQDRDILILSWLNRQDAGFAMSKDIPLATVEDLERLENRGFICRVPSDDALGPVGFAITPTGKKFQEGD